MRGGGGGKRERLAEREERGMEGMCGAEMG